MFRRGWRTLLWPLAGYRYPHEPLADALRQHVGDGKMGDFWAADDQQVHLVRTFFDQLDFRRFQVDLDELIDMDDPSQIPQLVTYGEELGRKILADETDRAMAIKAQQVPQ